MKSAHHHLLIPALILCLLVTFLPAHLTPVQAQEPVIPFALTDGQFVYGPNVDGFIVADYLASSAPHLSGYSETLDGNAAYYSINPRVLLTLMQMNTGLPGNPESNTENPFGLADYGFLTQLDVLGQAMTNAFYYHYYTQTSLPVEERSLPALPLADGNTYQPPPETNAGTYALIAGLALTRDAAALESALNPDDPTGFVQTYRTLFPDSDPLGDVNPLPSAAEVSAMAAPVDFFQFPYPRGESWSFNGVHNYFGCNTTPDPDDCSPADMSAIDFSPVGTSGWPDWGDDTSNMWVVAARGGTATRYSNCNVRIAHSDGWSTGYYHLENVQFTGTGIVSQNQPFAVIANTYAEATCSGGWSSAPHVHFTLLYNGVYYALNGTYLSGWYIHSGAYSYDYSHETLWLERNGVRHYAYVNLLNDYGVPTCTPSSNQVSLYTDANFGGSCINLNIGDYANPAAMGISNDAISSLRVGANVQAVVCRDDNFSNTCETFTADDGNLSDNSVGDNQISSARVQTRGTSNWAFRAYELGDFNGEMHESSTSITDFSSIGFNDRTESIRINSGYEIYACSDSNYSGTCARAMGPVEYADINALAQGLRDGLSSVMVCSGACPSAPAAPTLSSPSAGYTFDSLAPVTLSWNSISSATGYYVEFWGGPSVSINSGWITSTSWSLGTQWAGTYQWRVRARNVMGEGAWSETRTLIVRPGLPSGLTGSAPSGTQVNLSWNPSADAPGNIDGYRVYRSSVAIGTTNSSTTVYADSGLNCGATYVYTVRAYKGSVDSGNSSTFSITTPTCIPNAPAMTSPNEEALLNTRAVTFQWQNPGAYGQTGYTLRISRTNDPNNGPFLVDVTLASSTTSYSYSFTQDGTYYWFIRTNSSQGNSGWNSRSLRVDVTAPTASITYPLSNAYLTTSSITIQASAVDAVAGIQRVSFYTGYATSDPYHYWDYPVDDTIGSDGWSYTWNASEVADQSGVSVFIYAYDNAGNYIGVGNFYLTLDRAAPVSAVNSLPTTTATAAFTVIWSGSDSPAGIASYDVQYQQDGGEWTNWLNATTATRTTFTGVSSHTYAFRCRARDRAGNLEEWPSVADTQTVVRVPPTNDAIAASRAITTFPFSASLDTSGATVATTDPTLTACNRAVGNASIWYVFTPTSSGTVLLDTIGSDYDTMLGIFTGYTSSLTPVACNDDRASDDTASQLQVTLNANTRYYILVSEYAGMLGGGSEGDKLPTGNNGHPGGWLEFHFDYAPIPPAPVQITPASATLFTIQNPSLDWNDTARADHYEVQIAAVSLFTNPIATYTLSDSFLTVPDALPRNSTWYWRVRAVDVFGLPGPWSLTRYFRISLPAPENISPVDHVLTTRPVFDWTDVTGAPGYTLQYSTDPSFPVTPRPVVVNVVASTYTSVSDLPRGVMIYWHVRANGTFTSDWSATGSFLSANPPGIPLLSSPANAAIASGYQPVLDWADVPTATSYQIQFATTYRFTTLVLEDTSSSSDFTPSINLPSGATLYWRVRAVNSLDEIGSWSTYRYFRTPMLTPTLVEPANSGHALSVRPVFDWTDSPGATYYTVQYSTDPAFPISPRPVTLTARTSTITPSADLPRGVTLYWRVSATGTNTSAWSEVSSFLTANPPAAPLLSAPLNNALLTDYTPLLDWADVPSATHYEIQIATSRYFEPARIVQTDSSLVSDFTPATDLPVNTVYYWRVRALNALDEYGPWSTYFYFRTSLLQPVLVSPVSGSTAVSRRPLVDWSDVPGATSYVVQFSVSPTFSPLALQAASYTSQYTPARDLPSGQVVYWRVFANGSNPGPWSDAWTIQTP